MIEKGQALLEEDNLRSLSADAFEPPKTGKNIAATPAPKTKAPWSDSHRQMRMHSDRSTSAQSCQTGQSRR